MISAGGTMNREAVALGTPVYTTFQGRLGAVDERLIAEGRLRRLARRRASSTGQARARAIGAARVRRDPRVLVELLLSAVSDRGARARDWHGRVGVGAYNLHNAPTDPLGGPSPPPSLAAAARSGRGAGRARVLPRLPAALQQRPAARTTRDLRDRHDLVGAAGQPAGARARARLPAPLALRRPARLRGGRAGGGR